MVPGFLFALRNYIPVVTFVGYWCVNHYGLPIVRALLPTNERLLMFRTINGTVVTTDEYNDYLENN